MENKESNAKEPVKRVKGSQIAPAPSQDTQSQAPRIAPPSRLAGYQQVVPSPLNTTANQSFAMSAITPTGVGHRDGKENTNKSMMTTTPDLNPQSFLGSNGKGKMGQTHSGGTQKIGQHAEQDIELMSLLGPTSRKKTDNGVAPIDASANNWRKSKDRMVLYELQKRYSIEEIKTKWPAELIQWQQSDVKNQKKSKFAVALNFLLALYTKQVTGKNDLILHVTEQSRLEKNKNYEDRWPLLNLRKELQRIRIKINMSAYNVLKHKAFESICMAVIGFNCYCLATSDPTAEYPTYFDQFTDNMFLGLYSIEMAIKLLALGFIFNEGAYLRDPWNILDFVIVSSAWLTFLQEAFGGGGGGSSVGALRAFRVLRPLRTVTSIKGLQVLVVAVLKSIPLLKDTFLILTFFFLIFAIAGLQLLTGLTKQVCVHIDTGKVNLEFRDDEANQGLCGGANYCPVGDFCGQQIAGADYGTTNYDNIFWGLLNVFVTITMEGWSEFMVKYQKTYTWAVGPAFYIPMAYLGGYFFLNLLLAVINSSFSSSNAIQQAKLLEEREKAKKKKKPVLDDDWKDVNDGEPVMEVGVTEFFIAKRVAKKMMEKLRARQATKLLEEAFRKQNPGADDEDEAPVTQQALIPKEAPKEPEYELPSVQDEQVLKNSNQQSSEDIQDELSDESRDHRADVVKFLEQLNKEAEEAAKPVEITPLPTSQTFAKTDTRVQKQKKVSKFNIIPKIQPAKDINKIAIHVVKEMPQSDSKFDDILDIGKLLEIGSKQNINDEHQLDLSFISAVNVHNPHFSDDDDKNVKKNKIILGDDENSSVILSDSSFGDQITQLQKEAANDIKHRIPTLNPGRSAILNDIQRKLRRSRTMAKKQQEEETRALTGMLPDDDQAAQDKTKKEKKEETDLIVIQGIVEKNQAQKQSLVGSGNESKRKDFLKKISNTEDTFLSMQRPTNPYEFIDVKTQKIEINSGMPYQGASTDEIFELRTLMNEAKELEESNPYLISSYLLSLNKEEIIQDSDDEYIKPTSDPYQLKTVYSIKPDDEYDPYPDDEEAIQLELQPYDTSLSIGFSHLLTHKPIKFRARRSDIIVSSTLQITITPADSQYVPMDQALLSKEQIQDWVSKRHEFRAHNVKTATLHPKKPKDFLPVLTTETLLKAVKRQAEIRNRAAMSVDEMTQGVQDLQTQRKDTDPQVLLDLKREFKIPKTLLQQPLAPEVLNQLNETDRRLYDIQKNKWEAKQKQLKKSAQKPSDIQFTLEDAKTFELGNYHDEQNDEEEQEVVIEARNKTNYFVRDEDFYSSKLEDFEKKTNNEPPFKPRFINTYSEKKYIPIELKEELNLPDEIDDNIINYNEIIKKDCNRKRKTPMWSGQDILSVGLNEELSEIVISQINEMRVWPKGLFGLVKKFRVFLKMIIKHSLFNNMLMAAVMANTVVMSLASYGITETFEANLDSANLFFTWFFIVEMAIKFTAIGVRKYFADKMNFLDCAIVSLSIMEMILTAVGGGSGGNLSAFKTIRVLRTLRVLRITRLLRSLESMRMIISVFKRSASSFAYITMLLFVFLFIYTLLGMQVFGGLLDLPDGKTRANYDTFLVAFYTAFQVMTAENWNGNVIDYLRSPAVPIFIPPVYLVSWIFIGNYVLLNLFLAILLDSFLEEDGEDGVDVEEMARQAELKRRQNVEKEKIRRLKKIGASLVRSGTGHIPGLKSGSKKSLLPNEIIFDDVDDMDNKHLTDLFVEIGIIKHKDKVREEANMFLGVEAARSLYLFSKTNPIRIYAYKLYKHKYFENIVMFLIALSSLKLAVATYEKYLPKDSIILTVSEQFDVVLNLLFLFECCTKLIALGFILDEGSYIRDSWNQLDFFIVCSSMMDMTLQNIDIPAIKVLRLLRTLRPLRVISTNVAMKLIVAALFESVGAIANVVVVVVAVWTMFAIFGMNLYAGKFYYCKMDGEYSYVELTLHACENAGGTWQPWYENFDNIGQSLLTLFCEASTESWPDVLIRAIDASAIDYGPVVEIQKINGMFFIGFMLIGNFFLMNFFTGVMFLKYAQAARREKKGFTTDQLAWIDIQRMIVNAVCPFEMQYKPTRKQKFRLKVWGLVNSLNFEKTIMSVIVLNVFQMALYHQTATEQMLQLLEYANYLFTLVFILEAGLKLFTYRLDYFKTAWNKFDFFVCCASLLDIAMGFLPGQTMKTLSAAPQLARIMRVLRVTRIIKLAGKNEGLQALISTITLAVGPIMNVFILLCLVLFIFSVLGVFFFGGINSQWEGEAFYEYKSFVDFHHAIQLMFVLTTGESWNYFMYDAWTWGPYCTEGYNCGSQYAPLFFIAFVMTVQFVMINLFALVVIDQFEMYYMADDNPISKFKKNYEVFQRTWIMMSLKYKCIKMREKQLFDFFRKLPTPIGLPQEMTENDIRKVMLKMGIRSDNGYVYFNELLYRCMRRQYGNFKLGRKLQIRELTTQYMIYCQTCKVQNQEKLIKDHELFFSKMIGNGKSVNPFLTMMYYRISFQVWRKHAKKQLKLKQHQEALERKAKKLEAMGRTFVPYPLEEEKTKVQHVMIEVDEILYLTSEEEVVQEKEGFEAILEQEDKSKLEAENKSKVITFAERKATMKERSQTLKMVSQSLMLSSSQQKKNKQVALLQKSFYSTASKKPVVIEEPKVQAAEPPNPPKHKLALGEGLKRRLKQSGPTQ